MSPKDIANLYLGSALRIFVIDD